MWSNNVNAWQAALEHAPELLQQQAHIFQQVAVYLSQNQPRQEDRAHIVDLATLIVHATITMIGHKAGVVRETACQPERRIKEREGQIRVYEAINKYEEAKKASESEPQHINVQVQRVMEWTLAAAPSSPQGFAMAAKEGQPSSPRVAHQGYQEKTSDTGHRDGSGGKTTPGARAASLNIRWHIVNRGGGPD